MTTDSTTAPAELREDTHLAGRVLVAGFGVAIATWCAAYLTHMPWAGLPANVAGPLVILAWAVAAIVAGWATRGQRAVLVGALGGLLTALLGVLILGSMLVEQPAGAAPAPGATGLRTANLLYVPGFLALGVAIGAAGSLIGARKPQPDRPDWLARFGILTCFALVPLIVTGGAVTSTGSGMAIHGWPGSDAANMFLYPISLMADPQRFLEHTHRLFGTLVGLTCITLLLYTFGSRRSGAVKAATALLLAAVVVQGILGGYRVIENERVLALVHGISAQLVLALAVAIAAALSPSFRAPPVLIPAPAMGRLRGLTLVLLAAIVFQLSMGATYRHFRTPHALYTHVGLSLVIVILALLIGVRVAAVGRENNARLLRRTGTALWHTVLFQFVLGWAALIVLMISRSTEVPSPQPGGGPIPVSTAQAVLTTAHQAVGAALFAVATLNAVWVRRLALKRSP